jgi:hypothetical protein
MIISIHVAKAFETLSIFMIKTLNKPCIEEMYLNPTKIVHGMPTVNIMLNAQSENISLRSETTQLI